YISPSPMPHRLQELTLFPYTTLFRSKKSRKVVHSVGQEVIAAVGCAIDRGERERRALCNRGCKTSAASAHVILRDADRRDAGRRSEEHTSELQSRGHLVCRLLLEKKN